MKSASHPQLLQMGKLGSRMGSAGLRFLQEPWKVPQFPSSPLISGSGQALDSYLCCSSSQQPQLRSGLWCCPFQQCPSQSHPHPIPVCMPSNPNRQQPEEDGEVLKGHVWNQASGKQETLAGSSWISATGPWFLFWCEGNIPQLPGGWGRQNKPSVKLSVCCWQEGVCSGHKFPQELGVIFQFITAHWDILLSFNGLYVFYVLSWKIFLGRNAVMVQQHNTHQMLSVKEKLLDIFHLTISSSCLLFFLLSQDSNLFTLEIYFNSVVTILSL